MDPHKETQASDLASNKKRKFVYTTEVATPDKKLDSKLGDGQLSKGQQPVQSVVPNEATLSAEVQKLERQVLITLDLITRLELTQHAIANIFEAP